MGCTLDHSLVAFGTSRRYTERVFLVREVPLRLALQTFKDANERYFILKTFYRVH